jgi:uncharacterized protein YjcR
MAKIDNLKIKLQKAKDLVISIQTQIKELSGGTKSKYYFLKEYKNDFEAGLIGAKEICAKHNIPPTSFKQFTRLNKWDTKKAIENQTRIFNKKRNDKVNAFRSFYEAGKMNAYEISRKAGTSPKKVLQIINNEKWNREAIAKKSQQNIQIANIKHNFKTKSTESIDWDFDAFVKQKQAEIEKQNIIIWKRKK